MIIVIIINTKFNEINWPNDLLRYRSVVYSAMHFLYRSFA